MRRATTTLLAVALPLGTVACATGGVDEALGPEVRQVAAAPPPVEECRELGGGWQWRGSQASGTAAIGHRADLDRNDEFDDGTAVLMDSQLDDEELRRSVKLRDAAGWTETQLRELELIGSDYDFAVGALRFDGSEEEFERRREKIEDLLGAAPRCDAG